MIRFCDKEICCITEGNLDRQQLIAFFLGGHRNEPVCILKENGEYVGRITYDSLLGKDIADAVKKEAVVLDHDIWKNGREYFKSSQKEFGGEELLPVLDKEHRLLCFAYEDEWANRELRMLEELSACGGALDFKDVYPEYDCVMIRGCNELAFSFAEYLVKRGVSVRTEGMLWEELTHGDACVQEGQCLDYRRLVIYGEGLGPQEERIELRNSVSAEFECIDRIYEENVRKGFIRNTKGSFEDLLDRLRGKQICILGIGERSLNAYDLLLGYGIDICCFICEEQEEQGRKLLGKRIIKRIEAIESLKDVIFINPAFKHSMWGTVELDFYSYMGYKRNESFFLLRDYIEFSANGLRNAINYVMEEDGKRLLLTGDPWLCLKLKKTLETENKEMRNRILYCDVLEEYTDECKGLVRTDCSELRGDESCLPLLPGHHGCLEASGKMRYLEKERERYREALKKQNIRDFAVYSLNHTLFYGSGQIPEEGEAPVWKVGTLLIGSIEYGSGNAFFKELLRAHPNILTLPFGYLSSNLFSICIRLSIEKREGILPLFWRLYDREGLRFENSGEWESSNKEEFNCYMEEMLKEKDKFESWELFILIHLAYAKAQGKTVKDLSDMVIYWEPHSVDRKTVEEYTTWLYKAGSRRFIVNVVRNAVTRAGTSLRISGGCHGKTVFRLLCEPSEEKKEYAGWERLTLRFEDLKSYPEENMLRFCEKLGIPWRDELLNGQTGYNSVTGFDLAPVYRTNEKYFSAFDRFRLSLATGLWQKRYGYPYVSSLQFGRRELQEMFAKEFRFEKELVFQNEEEKIRYLKLRRGWMEHRLWEMRIREILDTGTNGFY